MISLSCSLSLSLSLFHSLFHSLSLSLSLNCRAIHVECVQFPQVVKFTFLVSGVPPCSSQCFHEASRRFLVPDVGLAPYISAFSVLEYACIHGIVWCMSGMVHIAWLFSRSGKQAINQSVKPVRRSVNLVSQLIHQAIFRVLPNLADTGKP